MKVGKKKILYIVEAMGGGIFTHLVTLANGLCDDFDITIVHGIRPETPDNYRDYFDEKVELIYIEDLVRAFRPIKNHKAIIQIKRIINRIRPDIIHCHSSKAGVFGRVRFNSYGYDVLYSPHGYSFLMQDINPFMRKVYKTVEKYFGRKRSLTVACGKGEWRESKSVSKYSTYISNGINTSEIDQILAGESSEHSEFTVCTLGRMMFQKNPELFNEIAKRLPDVKFVWIGDGELSDEIDSPNVQKTGWLPRAECLKALNKADVFVLTSRWEGLPMSLLEAMYLKKACVVSNVIGNTDVVTDQVTGYVCHTSEEYARVISDLKEHFDQDVVERAYNLIVEDYTDKSFCSKYKKLYEDIVYQNYDVENLDKKANW